MITKNRHWARQLGIPALDRYGGALVIQKGLSVTVGEYRIDLVKDEVQRIATVRVSTPHMPEGVTFNSHPHTELQDAADMLAERAQRFMPGWRIVRWTAPTSLSPKEASGNEKNVGYIPESWRHGA
jgi:hypothetical protein